jgi:hypothetical protein
LNRTAWNETSTWQNNAEGSSTVWRNTYTDWYRFGKKPVSSLP